MSAAAAARDVDLGVYRVSIGVGLLDRVGDLTRERAPAHRYAIVTDDQVGPRYAARVAASFGDARTTRVVTIPAGEAQKTRETWARVTDALLADGFGRDSAVVALGGGVVGDHAGFVAATFMRGIPYVQVPTTVLAMVDASVGGKTGVDTAAGKNLVGAFHQPAAVLADPRVLETLPVVHLRAGLAEVIKHGVIADADYFDRVVATLPRLLGSRDDAWIDVVSAIVLRSVEIKAAVVMRDERESGLRKTLNFGHTLGHAIELCDNYRLPHGEAIAAGMVLEADIAERAGIAARGTMARVREAVTAASLPTRAPDPIPAAQIHAATRADKKARGGLVEYALPRRIGAMACGDRGWTCAIPDELVLDVLHSTVERRPSGATVSIGGGGAAASGVALHLPPDQPHPAKRPPMSSFATYLLGFIILVIGLAIAAYLLNVPAAWIMVGVIVLIGLGVLMATSRTKPRDPQAPPPPPPSPPRSGTGTHGGGTGVGGPGY